MRYDPLQTFLSNTPRHVKKVVLGFRQIELLIGGELPRSASEYREWWANQEKIEERPQAKAWTLAGFEVEEVAQQDRWVHFVRTPKAL